MSTEVTRASDTLTEQMEWAKAVAVGGILPEAYRGKPADVLIAANLGASMGLSPAESLYRIHVIKGKPTASAELIASCVRRAGHKLRVTGDATSATAIIIRADDPDFEFTETRDLAWVQAMGLASNDNYRKQPATMLKNRAITAVARLACPEALYGVTYTVDELDDFPDAPTARPTVAEAYAEPVPVEAVVVTPEPDPAHEPSLTRKQSAAIGIHIKRPGIERADYLALASEAAGRDVAGTSSLTEREADAVLLAVAALPDAHPVSGVEVAKAAVREARAEQGELGGAE